VRVDSKLVRIYHKENLIKMLPRDNFIVVLNIRELPLKLARFFLRVTV